METTHLIKILDVVIILVWSVVSLHFVARFLKLRKLVSLALSLMPVGWVALGLGAEWQSRVVWLMFTKVVAILAGSFLIYTIIRVERHGR